jgi:arylsulfatase A
MTVREFAFNQRYKLYRTGEFFDLTKDWEERQPLTVALLDGEAARTAKMLQGALDQFKDARPSELDRAFEQANKGKDKDSKAAKRAKRKDKK